MTHKTILGRLWVVLNDYEEEIHSIYEEIYNNVKNSKPLKIDFTNIQMGDIIIYYDKPYYVSHKLDEGANRYYRLRPIDPKLKPKNMRFHTNKYYKHDRELTVLRKT